MLFIAVCCERITAAMVGTMYWAVCEIVCLDVKGNYVSPDRWYIRITGNTREPLAKDAASDISKGQPLVASIPIGKSLLGFSYVGVRER